MHSEHWIRYGEIVWQVQQKEQDTFFGRKPDWTLARFRKQVPDSSDGAQQIESLDCVCVSLAYLLSFLFVCVCA